MQTVSLCTVIYTESFSCVYAHAYAHASVVSFKLNIAELCSINITTCGYTFLINTSITGF